MSDDYLWDRSGAPDPDVERLERVLGRLRTPLPPPPRLREGWPYPVSRAYLTARFLGPALAAAAAIILMVGVTWRTSQASRSWEVSRLAGQPRIESTAVADTAEISVGQTLVTDEASRARMNVSTIGQVVVDRNSQVRLVDTRRAHHQLALRYGTLHAFITAPPGQFIVNTPSSTATDLGCVYTLEMDEDGRGMLSVTAGWVAFEFHGRESFVPAGASSRTDPRRGPGTPRYDDADEAFRNALDTVDEGSRSTSPGSSRAQKDDDKLAFVLQQARTRDAMTLWHLISHVDAADRAAVVDALASRAPMPAGVTRDAALRLDRAALDQWWDSLGLRETGWWRKWKRELVSW